MQNLCGCKRVWLRSGWSLLRRHRPCPGQYTKDWQSNSSSIRHSVAQSSTATPLMERSLRAMIEFCLNSAKCFIICPIKERQVVNDNQWDIYSIIFVRLLLMIDWLIKYDPTSLNGVTGSWYRVFYCGCCVKLLK